MVAGGPVCRPRRNCFGIAGSVRVMKRWLRWLSWRSRPNRICPDSRSGGKRRAERKPMGDVGKFDDRIGQRLSATSQQMLRTPMPVPSSEAAVEPQTAQLLDRRNLRCRNPHNRDRRAPKLFGIFQKADSQPTLSWGASYGHLPMRSRVLLMGRILTLRRQHLGSFLARRGPSL